MRTLATLCTIAWLAGPAVVPAAATTPAESEAAAGTAFLAHLDRLAPDVLKETGVAGMAVGLVLDGRVAATRAYGVADRSSDAPVDDRTVFNAGSISKPIAAWTVLALVEAGVLDLDAPVRRYVPEWTQGPAGSDTEEITLRMLLSHTAGLGLAAVPEFPPAAKLPSLEEAVLAESSAIRIEARPGTQWGYSGGGYAVLQLAVERATGRPFAAVARERVLAPLSLEESSFTWEGPQRARAATPYDDGSPTVYFRYWGEAAAAFNTTVRDLARFAAANLPDARGGEGPTVLRPETISLAHAPSPHTEQRFGIRYGLGFEIWGLRGGGRIVGHNGQNTGWSATMWIAPETRDALVVLTNDSDGRAAWKWMLCDWAHWISGTRWRGMCTDRPSYLPPAPAPRAREAEPAAVSSPARLAFIDGLLSPAFAADGPGAAVLVARGGRTLHSAGYGRAEVESGAPITPRTSFYLASLAKPITALAVARLIEEGRLRYDDRLGRLLDGLPPAYAEITVDQLLTHTSGIPDYYRFVRWREVEQLGNAEVLALLREHPDLEFPPGERFAYSNSGYVILSEIISRVSGGTYAEFLERLVFDPLTLEDTFVHDSPGKSDRPHAFGYALSEDGPTPRDYALYRLADGSMRPTGFLTTGAGGVYSSAEDLQVLLRAFFEDRLLHAETRKELLAPRVPTADLEGLGAPPRSARGWMVNERYGATVYWQDGAFVGASTLALHVPDHDFTVILLSNAAAAPLRDLAVQISDRLLAAR